LQSVESVLRSILLLLDDPEINSPANVDAGKMYRDQRAMYIEKAKETVKVSKQDIPEGFVMPKTLTVAPPPKIDDDADFWNESDAEEDFGGSDSDEDQGDFDMDDEECEDQESEGEEMGE